MKVDTDEYGTTTVRHKPLRNVPFYSDWIEVLEQRGIAVGTKKELGISALPPMVYNWETNEAENICIGCGVQFSGLFHEGHRSEIGDRNTRMRFDKITIGGFIQVPVEEVLSRSERHVRWQRRPVMAKGLGCETCKAKFRDIEAQTRIDNEYRSYYGTVLARMAIEKARLAEVAKREEIAQAVRSKARCVHGLIEYCCAVCLRNAGQTKASVPSVKFPAMATPFIDVFDHDVSGPVGD